MKPVTFHPSLHVDESVVKYAVIVARYHGKWIFCRHWQRETWEIPGGHVEHGETPLDAARRELYEETGAVNADIQAICAYNISDYGLLCFAQVECLERIPDESEIAEIQLFEALPDNLTYRAHAQLFHYVQGWLNMQSGADEMWDIYDENRNRTGKLHRRGDFLAQGEYHLTVQVWMRNSKGEYLITKRSPNKGFPNMWETTGGSALAGDDSLAAALREVKEETGLELQPENGRIVMENRGESFHEDVWLFEQDFDLDDVCLQEGETCDARYATKTEIKQMFEDGSFVPVDHVKMFLDIC